MSAEIQNEELPARWEIELEFVQSLSNLDYLNYLSHKKYFEDPRFRYYLKYLYNYWKRPENLKYLIYPNCMEILRLLIANDNFKVEVVKQEFRDLVINDMVENWKTEKSVDIKNSSSLQTQNVNHTKSTDLGGNSETEKNLLIQKDTQKEDIQKESEKISQPEQQKDTKIETESSHSPGQKNATVRNGDKELNEQNKINEKNDQDKAVTAEQGKANEVPNNNENDDGDTVMSQST